MTVRPPAHLEPYVLVLGQDTAVEFLLAFGGAELVLFRDPRRGRLVELVGRDNAVALAEISDRFQLPRRVPTGKPWIARVWHQKGLPVAEIARRLHTSDVTIRKYLADDDRSTATDLRQLRLF